MRKHGTKGNVSYKLVRWSIRHLAYEYRIETPAGNDTIHVSDWKEMRKALENINLKLSELGHVLREEEKPQMLPLSQGNQGTIPYDPYGPQVQILFDRMQK